MSGFWWLALLQFMSCGATGLFCIAAPKFHHFPSSDRPYIIGVSVFLLSLALIGLTFMSVFH